MYNNDENPFWVDADVNELKQKLFANRSKAEIRTTEVDMERVKHYQSLPKNLYTPDEKKKREAEIMEQILRKEKEEQN